MLLKNIIFYKRDLSDQSDYLTKVVTEVINFTKCSQQSDQSDHSYQSDQSYQRNKSDHSDQGGHRDHSDQSDQSSQSGKTAQNIIRTKVTISYQIFPSYPNLQNE